MKTARTIKYALGILLLFVVLFAQHANAQSDEDDPIVYIGSNSETSITGLPDEETAYIGADSLPRYINYWLFSTEDDSLMAHPDYNDSNWKVIRLGTYSKKSQQFFGDTLFNHRGIGWLRKKIYVDSTLKHIPLAFEIDQNFASELYVDGYLIKKYGKIAGKEEVEYYTPVMPQIFNVGGEGIHTIAIRFADYHDTDRLINDGVIGIRMVIENANRAVESAHLTEKVLAIVSWLIMGVLGMLGLLHLLLWLFRSREIGNLFVSIMFLCMGISVVVGLQGTQSTNPDYSFANQIAINVLFLLMLWGLSGFMNASFEKLGKRFWIVTMLTVVIIILGFLDIPYYEEITYLVAVVILAEALVIGIKAMRRKENGANIIGGQLILLCGTLLIGIPFIFIADGKSFTNPEGAILVFLGILGMLAMVSFLSIPFTISAFLAKRYASINEDLSNQLEHVKLLSEKNMAQEQEKKKILEDQKHQLEIEVEKRTREIVEEKKKSDDLLLNILPEEVAEELKQKGQTEAKHFDEVTVMFTDFVDFTKTGERLTAEQLVSELDTCFKAFDEIMIKYGIEKIKTIGDAYMAVCGLPTPVKDHANRVVQAAKEIKAYMQKRQQEYPDTSFKIRVGIHSGNVVAGIVGVKKFAYDIWGDTVNTAARMESSSEPNHINISETTYQLVKDVVECNYRGEIDVKGKGALKMYFVG